VSVGHIARLLEEAGIPTVIIAVKAFQKRLEAMHAPRVLITPHLMGRPLGRPGDRNHQRQVIEAALDLLETAAEAGAVREVPAD
jgi:hypothetical protein